MMLAFIGEAIVQFRYAVFRSKFFGVEKSSCHHPRSVAPDLQKPARCASAKDVEAGRFTHQDDLS